MIAGYKLKAGTWNEGRDEVENGIMTCKVASSVCSARVTTLVPCDRLESRTRKPQAHMEAVFMPEEEGGHERVTSNSCRFIIAQHQSCPEAHPHHSHSGFRILLFKRENRIAFLGPLTSFEGPSCSLRWSTAPFPLLLFHPSPTLPVSSDRDSPSPCPSPSAVQLPVELQAPICSAQLATPSVPTIRLAQTPDQVVVDFSEM